MTNLRKEARGRPCMVRLPGCDMGGETTVLAHYRMPGMCGVGMKPSDLAFGAWCCAPCHDAIDGRTRSEVPRDTLRLFHAEGVMRTLATLEEEGVI